MDGVWKLCLCGFRLPLMNSGIKKKQEQSNKSVGMRTSTEKIYVSPYMKFKSIRFSSEEFIASRNIEAAKSP
jgi:hypothetical protein